MIVISGPGHYITGAVRDPKRPSLQSMLLDFKKHSTRYGQLESHTTGSSSILQDMDNLNHTLRVP